MAREDRLGLVKQALTFLVDRLRPRDTVAIVDVRHATPGSSSSPPSAQDAERILSAIDSLQPSGSTNAEAGLAARLPARADALREGGINRVILASDGVANLGDTDPESILARVRPDAEQGIQLVTVGFGMGNYNDVLMEQLADKGDGFYAYVNRLDDARTLFGEQLTSTLDTVALDARAQVEFNPDVVEAYRLVGLREPRDARLGVPQRRGRRRRHRRRPRLDRALRPAADRRAGGIFDSGRIAHGPSPLDRPGLARGPGGRARRPTSTTSPAASPRPSPRSSSTRSWRPRPSGSARAAGPPDTT